MKEFRLKLLKYMIDTDGTVSSEGIRNIVNSNITSDYLYDYDVSRNEFVRTPESELFEFGIEYFKIYNNMISSSSMNSIIMNAAHIGSKDKENLLDILDELKSVDVKDNEIEFHKKNSIDQYVSNKSINIFYSTIERQKKDPLVALEYAQRELSTLVAQTDQSDAPNSSTMELWQFVKWQLGILEKDGEVVTPKAFYGFPAFDRVIGGLYAGETTLFAGPSSSGKSFLCQAIAYHNALERDLKVVYVNIENLDHQIWARLVSYYAQVSLAKITSGNLDEEDKKIIKEAMAELEDKKDKSCLMIPPSKAGNVAQIRSEIELHYGSDKPDLIVLDYLDELLPVVPVKGGMWENRLVTMTEIKKLATHFQCPLVSPTQLNKDDNIPYKSLIDKSDNIFLLKPDKDRPIIAPNPEYDDNWFGTPGIVEAKLFRARNTGKNVHFSLRVDPTRGMVTDMSTVFETQTIEEVIDEGEFI